MNRNGLLVATGAMLALTSVVIAAEQKSKESKKSVGDAAT
jgi:hypothetical protein